MKSELKLEIVSTSIPTDQQGVVETQSHVVRVGRADSCEVTVSSPIVSGEHLEFRKEPDGWQVIDLDSSNGSYLNGQPIEPMTPRAIVDGDSIRLGVNPEQSVELIVRLETPTDAKAAADTQAASTDGEMGMQSRGVTVLSQVTETLRIGRNPASEIHLDAPNVSWLHASIEMSASGCELVDEGSTNGTYVAGERVEGRRKLEIGDVVKIGRFMLEFDGETLIAREAANGMRVDVIQLRKDVGPAKQRKTILHDVSLTVRPTEFVAFLGPSGAGKSTLLKSICGAAPSTDGWVLVNGDSLSDTFELYRSQIGYVPQDDIIHTDLPVESALRHAAKLRLPSDTRPEEIDRRIDDVLQVVELRGKEDVPIKALSGGQRKRVSIAVELLAEPLLLFLDEPTSGLDPGLDRKMMETLRRLARQGRTVFLVTHATANLSQCDHICLMAQGRMVYFGPPDEAFEFFGVESGEFAEIYSRVDDVDPQVAAENAARWAERYRNSEYYTRYVLTRNRELHTQELNTSDNVARARSTKKSRWRQLRILIARYLELVVRDRVLLTILLAVMPLIGFLVGAISDSHWLTGMDACLEECVESPPEAVTKAAPNFSDLERFAQAEACLEHSEMPRRASLLPWSTANVDQITADRLEYGAGCPQAEHLDEAGYERLEEPRASTQYSVKTDAQRVLFILALASVLLGLFAAAYEVVKERSIYGRERMVNLSITSYLSSKFLVLGSFALLQGALLLGSLQLAGVELPSLPTVLLPTWPELYVTIVLATLASIATGLFISTITPTRNAVIYIVLLVLFFQMLLSGGVFELSAITDPISRLNVTRWTMEGLGATMNMEALADLGRFAMPTERGTMQVPLTYPDDLNFARTKQHLATVWGVLAGFTILFGALTAVALKRADVKMR
jgi:ABC-type multidrug transport system ATPase subunit/pSer/pThr/pTyr-binding forkhead associated (FHA) protein